MEGGGISVGEGKLALNRPSGEADKPQVGRFSRSDGKQATGAVRHVSIHPLSNVSPAARLGSGVSVGAFATIEADVELGDHCTVASGAVLKAGVTAGSHNEFGEHCVIGGAPQHAGRPQHVGRVVIGENNVFREFVTIHRALKPGTATTVGDGNYVMASAHFGHDCVVSSNAIFANGAMLGGHATVEDRAFVSGAVAIHQFCRVGRMAMVGGHARVVQDIPPFMLVDGQSGCIVGLNVVGLRRSGHTPEDIATLKNAYKVIYRRGLPWREVLETLRTEFAGPSVGHLLAFLSSGTRGFVQERRAPPNPMLKLRVPEDDAEAAVRIKAG